MAAATLIDSSYARDLRFIARGSLLEPERGAVRVRRFEGVTVSIHCKGCGYRFLWHAMDTGYVVYDEVVYNFPEYLEDESEGLASELREQGLKAALRDLPGGPSAPDQTQACQRRQGLRVRRLLRSLTGGSAWSAATPAVASSTGSPSSDGGKRFGGRS